MASKRRGSVAAAFGRRFVATMEQGSRVKCCSESTRRAVSSSSWKLPQLDNVGPGLMASVSTWRHQDQHPVRREEGGLPWALQGIQRQQPVLLSEEEDLAMTVAETRKVLRHVNAVALQKRLQSDPRDSFGYPRRVELMQLEEQKAEIDALAWKQVRRYWL